LKKINNIGISIIICCYNSADRLLPTFEHLAQLERPAETEVEVLVVDNASTDDTANFSRQLWQDLGSPFPLSVFYEGNAGLSYARRCGIRNAKYELAVFCDDDNWLVPDYLVKAKAIMESSPEVGVACGQIKPVFEMPPPNWFLSVQQALALGQLQAYSGYIEPPTVPWGAGMVMRADLLKKAYELGFNSLLSDRKGKELSSGGDTEICYLLRLAGYRWWYDASLKLEHYITKGRLDWTYIKKLYRGFGSAIYKIEKNYQPHWTKKLNHRGVLIEKIKLGVGTVVANLFFDRVKMLDIERQKGFLKALTDDHDASSAYSFIATIILGIKR
jgi:glycosyltransferase involved in cell wall biosynthesis